MTRHRVVIVGGGLAGMAAAEALSRVPPQRRHPAFEITLLESKRIAGGRAGSYVDPETGTEVDYCQHAAMGCCTNLIEMLDRCGLQHHFRRDRSLTFLHPEHPPSRFAPNRWLPPPLHLLGTVLAQRYLSARQKCELLSGLWRLMRTPPRALGDCRAREWLARADQSDDTVRNFWDVILVSALGESTGHVSMAAARKVLIDGFAIARGASDVLIPTVPLADLFGRLLSGVLAGRGVEIRTGHPVQQITPEARVITPAGDLEADAVIGAVPWHQIDKLFDRWPDAQRSRLPNLDAISKIPSSPITGLHLWFDSPITALDHAVMVGTTAQWLFRDPFASRHEPAAGTPAAGTSGAAKQHYYQVVISASKETISGSKQALVDTVLAELRHAFPAARSATLLRHRLVTDPKSVFSLRPEVDALRPAATTQLPWLHLAGDWTQTGWPATMEGAVISGRLAAEAVAEQLGSDSGWDFAPPNRLLCPGLPPGRLARWLIRRD
ncbi:15-cis-phytoene desaturase [Stieleria neptunia]|uniref:15-cis-phytoene desaturase n=1 Tax=Stieleria neptunia TaxID=2527979 RepID=A0A518I1G0_9BACT|nr:hydroxysqualene dehydroxylase HpnE [Stieleria neptunia]QDV46935.1 15-cis-phytoene desaturase [Stieleria neptunia]